MPTILRKGPYRVYFFSHEANEPPHVHVDRGECTAKIWLGTLQVARNIRFPAHELSRVERLIASHRQELLDAWHGYFGSRG